MLLNHEMPFFYLKTGSVPRHEAEFTLRPNSLAYCQRLLGPKYTVLVLVQDIPKLARVLRIIEFANFMGYEFTLASRRLLTPAEQKKLLLPFEQVVGGACKKTVTFKGSFDIALKDRIQLAMTQDVGWLRARAAEVHDLAVSMKDKGDMAF